MHSIVERTPLAADGKSGSVLERARLADGTRLILKRVEPHGDWIMRATADTERARTLYALGILERVPRAIDILERVPRAIDHAVDFAWYLAINASRSSATKDERGA